jgi:hypothetical protein
VKPVAAGGDGFSVDPGGAAHSDDAEDEAADAREERRAAAVCQATAIALGARAVP